jgi:hypothetical protein
MVISVDYKNTITAKSLLSIANHGGPRMLQEKHISSNN